MNITGIARENFEEAGLVMRTRHGSILSFPRNSSFPMFSILSIKIGRASCRERVSSPV